MWMGSHPLEQNHDTKELNQVQPPFAAVGKMCTTLWRAGSRPVAPNRPFAAPVRGDDKAPSMDILTTSYPHLAHTVLGTWGC